jgi:hypothetical protein
MTNPFRSGPRRYEFHNDIKGSGWYHSRSLDDINPKNELFEALKTEMKDATGIDMNVQER